MPARCPRGRSPASPGGRGGSGRTGGHSPPRNGWDGLGRAAGGGPGSLRRAEIGQRLPGEGVASGRPALGELRAGRCAGTGGEQTRQLPQGHGDRGGAAAAPAERKGLSRATGRSPEGGCGEGRRGGAGLVAGRAAAPPLRQPAGGLEAAAPPGLGCRGRAAPASVPGRAAGRRFPLRRSRTAACWQPGQQAAASWSVFFPQCPFISPSPLISPTCSLSFFLHSFYLISACRPLLLPFSGSKGFSYFLLFLLPSSCSLLGHLRLVPLNFLISSDFFFPLDFALSCQDGSQA